MKNTMLLFLLNDELPNFVNSLTFKAIITPHLDMLLLLSLPAGLPLSQA